jgi:lipoic acid synthetase/lipoate-protein ligase A
VEACSTDHNDVLIGGRKVSGWAVYQMQDRIIVHGTMLYDTCMDHMLASITPPAEKLQRKGVESVRQRITLLKDHTTLSLEEVKALIRDTLCHGELLLTPEDVRNIETIETTNYTDYIYGTEQ